MSDGIALPQPDDLTRREKEDAMGAYFMMFAAWGVGLPLPLLNLLAAGIYYGLNRRKSRFTAFHSLQSLLSQVPVTLVHAGLVFWLVRNLVLQLPFTRAFWIYLAFSVILNLLYLVMSIIALTRAYRGNFFYFPVFGPIAYDRWYGPGAPLEMEHEQRPNLPPGG